MTDQQTKQRDEIVLADDRAGDGIGLRHDRASAAAGLHDARPQTEGLELRVSIRQLPDKLIVLTFARLHDAWERPDEASQAEKDDLVAASVEDLRAFILTLEQDGHAAMWEEPRFV